MIAAITTPPTTIIEQVAASTPTERPENRAQMSARPHASAQPAPQAAALSITKPESRCQAIARGSRPPTREQPGERWRYGGRAMAARIMGEGACNGDPADSAPSSESCCSIRRVMS